MNNSLFQGGALVAQGLLAEEAAWRFLSTAVNVACVEDVRHMQRWQDVEVDYRAHLKNGMVEGFEVKSDRHIETKHNVLFEVFRIHHTALTVSYPGWGTFSKADFLLVYAPDSQSIRLFRFTELRKAFQKYTKDNRTNDRLFNVVASDELRTTLNVLIPLSQVKHSTYALLPHEGRWVMRPE